MARTAIPVQLVPAFGKPLEDLAWTAADAANDHEFQNTGRELLLVKNDDAASKTVTVKGIESVTTFQNAPDRDVVTDAGENSVAGPFEPAAFGQAGGLAHIDLTADTSLYLAVVRVGV